MKPIVNLTTKEPTRGLAHPPAFEFSSVPLGEPLGSKAIGANVTRVPPGRAAFPFHHHYANEEHFLILGGTGVLRYGAETFPVGPNDYIVTPAGGPETAHQLINTGEADLVYLALSTTIVPEVVGYPDSAKTGVAAVPWGQDPPRFVLRDARKAETGYWDGEDGANVAAAVAAAKEPGPP